MEYPKINTIFMRDNKGKIMGGVFSERVFEYLANCQWMWTEKIDGTNTRLIIKPEHDSGGYEISILGRTNNATFHPLVREYLTNLSMSILPKLSTTLLGDLKEMIIFGETFGHKIQSQAGQFYCPDGHKFIVFDMLINGWWAERTLMEELSEGLGLDCVPVVMFGTLEEAVNKVKEGFYSMVSEKPLIAEGLVGVPTIQLFDKFGRRIITKIKHKDFKNL